jgi:hypothetical protein
MRCMLVNELRQYHSHEADNASYELMHRGTLALNITTAMLDTITQPVGPAQ